MRKIMTIVASTLLLGGMIFTSCESSKVQQQSQTGVQMANPFVTCDTLEEAAKTAGFSMKLPTELPDWVIKTVYRASNVNTNLLEIIYPGDENYQREIRVRKAISSKKDVSGDYNSYEKEENTTIGGKKCLARMNGDKIYLVTWKDGKYDYSLRMSDGGSVEDFAKLMKEIK